MRAPLPAPEEPAERGLLPLLVLELLLLERAQRLDHVLVLLIELQGLHQVSLCEVVLRDLNVDAELKNRVWFPFWQGMLRRYFGGKAVERRLEELKDIIMKSGTQKMWEHGKLVDSEHGEQVREWQKLVQKDLEIVSLARR